MAVSEKRYLLELVRWYRLGRRNISRSLAVEHRLAVSQSGLAKSEVAYNPLYLFGCRTKALREHNLEAALELVKALDSNYAAIRTVAAQFLNELSLEFTKSTNT